MTSSTPKINDEYFMRLALGLAKRGLGTTAPNPSVGAVVVSPDYPFEILGQGWTDVGGRPHGEPQALAMAQRFKPHKVMGATLYVTLEPCSHHGQTPPCTDQIIAAGIKRVVCASADPDVRVAGQGFEKLRDAGIEVVENVLVAQGDFINLGHVNRITKKRPFVQLKLAVSANEMIASGNGNPVWVTGTQARNQGHLMRAKADAILVGSGTVLADNPSLTCRLPGLEQRSPIRVVLDSQLTISAKTTLVKTAKTTPLWLFCNNLDQNEHLLSDYAKLSNLGVKICKYNKAVVGPIDLESLLETLADNTNMVTRLMVEGGMSVLNSFLEAGFVDEFIIFKSHIKLEESAIAPFGTESLEDMLSKAGLVLHKRRYLGDNDMLIYRKA